MTRHELKALEADRFVEKVGSAWSYTQTHKKLLARLLVVIAAIAVLAILAFAYSARQKAARQADLNVALAVMDAQVTPESNQYLKTFPTQEAKEQAAIQAFSSVASKHNGTREGAFAQYYLGTIQAGRGDGATAERNLKAAIQSDREVGGLATVALAELYRGEGRQPEAEGVLRGLIDKPSALVSKEQAALLLADALVSKNPAEARRLIGAVRTQAAKDDRAALTRAADQVANRLGK